MKRISILLAALLLAASCSQGPSRLVLATYNLHHCEPDAGGDRNYEAQAAIIRELGPDVIALQELDSCNARSPEFQAEVLAELCGMKYLYHRTIPFGGGSYGIGMMYKPSLELIRSDFIPLPGKEPRGALIAEFDRLIYVSTHFCFQAAENRQASIDTLTGILKGAIDKPVFLAGDLNATDIPQIAPDWEEFSTGEDTFGHSGHSGRIDYILKLRGSKAKLKSTRVITKADGLSDHLPVVSEVKVR